MFFGAGALASSTLGRVVDHLGWRKTSVAVTLGSAAALAGIGLLTRGPVGLIAFLVLGGLSNGIAVPTTNAILVHEMPIQRRALTIGIKQAGVPAAAVVAGLSVPAIALSLGWQWVFLLAVAIPLAVLGVIATDRFGSEQPTPRSKILPEPLQERSGIVMISVAGGFGAAVASSLSVFFVLSVVLDTSLFEGDAARLLALGSAFSLIVRILLGWLADRLTSDGFNLSGILFFIGAGGVVLFANAQEITALVVSAILMFGAGWGWPGLLHFAVVNRFAESPGRATGVLNGGTMTGAALGPLVFGFLIEETGFQTAWMSAALLLVLAAVLTVVGARSVRRGVRFTAPLGDTKP